jgi:hypothetical protein
MQESKLPTDPVKPAPSFNLNARPVNRRLDFGPDVKVESLTEKYRPRTLADVVGQGSVVYQLQQFIEAPYSRGFLFSGATGTGKTTCARALAGDLGINPDWDTHEIKSATCDAEAIEKGLAALRQCGLNGGWKLLLIDEADTMSDKARKVLLSEMEDLPQRSIVVLTTNHPERFEARFLDRFEGSIPFASDCDLLMQDAQTLVDRVWLGETGRTDAPSVASLPDLCQCGAMSFRRVVNAVAATLRSWTPPEPFALENPETEAASIGRVYQELETEALLALPEFSEPTEPDPEPVVDVTIQVAAMGPVKAVATRSADSIIMEAIEDYRYQGLVATVSVWQDATTGQRSAITRRIKTIMGADWYHNSAGMDRFGAFLDAAAHGMYIKAIDPTPDPEDTDPCQPESTTTSSSSPSTSPSGLAPSVASGSPASSAGESGSDSRPGDDACDASPEPPSEDFPAVKDAAMWIERDHRDGMSGEDCDSIQHDVLAEVARVARETFPDYLTLIESNEFRSGEWCHSLYYHSPLDDYGKRRQVAGESVADYAGRVLGAASVARVARYDRTFYFVALKAAPEAPSGGFPDDVIAERKALVSQIVAEITAPRMTEDQVIDSFAADLADLVSRAAGCYREYPQLREGTRNDWHLMTDGQRFALNRFMDLTGFQREYHDEDGETEPDSWRYARFVQLCVTGQPILYGTPDPDPTDDGEDFVLAHDRDGLGDEAFYPLSWGEHSQPTMLDWLIAFPPPIPAEGGSGFSDAAPTIIIEGAAYAYEIQAEGIILTKPSGECHAITSGPDAPSCSCSSFAWRPGPCKHTLAVVASGLLPEAAPDFPEPTEEDWQDMYRDRADIDDDHDTPSGEWDRPDPEEPTMPPSAPALVRPKQTAAYLASQDDFDQARRNARYGHKDWLAWRNGIRCAWKTAPKSNEAALLATRAVFNGGTAFIIEANHGTLFKMGRPIAHIATRTIQAGHTWG